MNKEIGPIEKLQSLPLHGEVIEAIRTIYDPEIPLNIYDLGLIYDIRVDKSGKVEIDMTLTSPACPVAGSLPGDVEQRIREVAGVSDVIVNLVWDPPWDVSRLSEESKLTLGLM